MNINHNLDQQMKSTPSIRYGWLIFRDVSWNISWLSNSVTGLVVLIEDRSDDIFSFATGMNGDEDLGEDITMKGKKKHRRSQRED